jgi:hypothetical protein
MTERLTVTQMWAKGCAGYVDEVKEMRGIAGSRLKVGQIITRNEDGKYYPVSIGQAPMGYVSKSMKPGQIFGWAQDGSCFPI